ncbi:MYND-type zinc finger-containing chromatin reader ZMYND8-like isoform X1 [Tigriopus californicus]|uniref:MYND-type zinc finger-containing chromatin reader ZMYND8-like isoform X1 n=1 Tax=Tigriopus californicus TaxID=6832 RepID=UPI0027DAB31B|nr:MYND-type zinc finger-containing chromatin reader ZMYND8-like isoform X1 [Tigriopus californicus]
MDMEQSNEPPPQVDPPEVNAESQSGVKVDQNLGALKLAKVNVVLRRCDEEVQESTEPQKPADPGKDAVPSQAEDALEDMEHEILDPDNPGIDAKLIQREGDSALDNPEGGEDSSSESTSSKSGSGKRTSSRLQDPERAAKHKAFLQKVTVATNGSMESFLEQEATKIEAIPPLKRKISPTGAHSDSKRRRSSRNNSAGQDASNDCYCWICHKEGDVICCETCPRVFHLKCIQLENAPTEDWVCPECVLIMTAENMDTRSRAMRLLNVDQLCTLLRHALNRMRSISSIDPFLKPVDLGVFPAYKDYITCPMDLSAIERNIKRKQYGSTEAFLADTKWILHNCIIFNSLSSKLTSIAKTLVKICKHEMQEIENCPDCYMNAHTKKDSWFVAACRIPHLLVWAKLKGFPFWPGKAMRVNAEESVDVRFFGVHDRAWIPLKDVYLYSEEPPVHLKNKKKGNLESCVEEVNMYISNITEKFGSFQHAPPKTPLDPKREEEQIRILYPKCSLPFELGPVRRRTRTYSFSGSERSHSNTPTPSETDYMDDAHSNPPVESQTILEGTKTETEAGQNEANKKEPTDAETPMETTEVDKETKEDAKVKSKDSKDGDETKRSAVSPPCEVSSTTLMSEEEKEKKRKEKLAGLDETESDKDKKTVVKEVAVIAETSETVELEGVLNEDEHENELILDEEEIDDVEETPDDDLEGENESEPSKESSTKEVQEEKQAVSRELEGTEKSSKDDPTPSASPTPASAPEDKKKEAPQSVKEPETKEAPTVSEDVIKSPESMEIDDVEPDAEEILDDDDEAVDPSSLFGSGISISVVGKPVDLPKPALAKPASAKPAPAKTAKQAKPTEQPKVQAPLAVAKEKPVAAQEKPVESPPEVSIGSDISVTIVPKKANSSGPSVDEPPPKKMLRISVKKESELMGTTVVPQPAKDLVNVQSNVGMRSKNVFPRKSTDSNEGDEAKCLGKNPPDPIVTISKVQTIVSKDKESTQTSSMSLLKSSVNNIGQKPTMSSNQPPRIPTSSPILYSVSQTPPNSASVAMSSVGMGMSPMPKTSLAPSSLASILGAPRMNGPSYRNGPGGMPMPHAMQTRPGGPPMPSGMMRMPGPPGPYRGPSPGGPMGMPSLHPRPPTGPLSAPPNIPPTAGPVSEQLHKVATKLVDYMRGSLEDLFRELASKGSHEAHIKSLQLELEKMQWRHQQELAEVKHNADLILLELRQSMESEKQKTLNDIRKQADIDRQKAISETKKKQWCANCGKEAIFYCCWNTSYCDYPCQQAHWPSHMTSCAQNQSNQDDDSPSDNQDQAGGMDPSTAAHFLSRSSGGPPGPSRNAQPMNSRGLQGGPSGMHMNGPMGMNPRFMSQMGLRFPGGVHGGPGGPQPPRGMGQPGVRFPSSYFM